MTGEKLLISKEILQSVDEIKKVYFTYISHYIDYLNGIISLQRRVSTLRFERMTLIKYVKKLRFLNEMLHSYNLEKHLVGEPLDTTMGKFGSNLIKIMEILDLLNFYISQPLKGETISKTLNNDLVVSDETIETINDVYRIFIKCIQWMLEATGKHQEDPLSGIELIEFTKKCAIEDDVDFDEDGDILLQEVGLVESSAEYGNLLSDWALVLAEKEGSLNAMFTNDSKAWAAKFKSSKK